MNLTTVGGMIKALNSEAMKRAQNRLDNLAKPQRSLGILEELAVKLAGIAGEPLVKLGKKTVIVMAGDHGVVEEGISAFPQEVTRQMILNFLRGGAGINVLARLVNADVVVVDIGSAGEIDHPLLLKRKIKKGTENMARGSAMSREEAVKAVETGMEIATEIIRKSRAAGDGLPVVATGEMGIGNTTPSAAIIAAVSGYPVSRVVGPGTGLAAEKIRKKAEVIEAALAVNNPDPRDGLDLLAKVGGLEIAGLAGCIIGAAAAGIPIVIDGFISTAAAVAAVKICPSCRNYLLPSHLSAEPGHKLGLDLLGLKPLLHLEMRLGEGTGAVLAMNLLEAATRVISEMATFSEAEVSGPA